MASVKHTPRQVIENKLLAALDDGASVAVILKEADLRHLIGALRGEPVPDAWRLEFAGDLLQLLRGAFPDADPPARPPAGSVPNYPADQCRKCNGRNGFHFHFCPNK